MLLTPCVFPMIPITVNFFLKQWEKKHHRPLFLASISPGTIIVLLTLTMLIFGNVVVFCRRSNLRILCSAGSHPVALTWFPACTNMFELPSFLTRFAHGRRRQGGSWRLVHGADHVHDHEFHLHGAVHRHFLDARGDSKATLYQSGLHGGEFVYSTTFAAPFFFLALLPHAVAENAQERRLANSVKVTMGFVEIAAALKFLSIADYTLFPGRRVCSPSTRFSAALDCPFACCRLSHSHLRLAHHDPGRARRCHDRMFATISIGLAFYMNPLLFGIRPTGVVARAS